MTTSELIDMLRKADPEGTTHVRMYGGIPVGCERKPGYHDGAYEYFEDGKWVLSTRNDKVDIHTTDLEAYIDDMAGSHPIPPWEEVEKQFVFHLGDPGAPRTAERMESFMGQAKGYYNNAVNTQLAFMERHTALATERYDQGWRFFQPKTCDTNSWHTYYYWRIVPPDNKETTSSIADTEGILHSGLFTRHDNNERPGYYEWIANHTPTIQDTPSNG